MCSSWAFDRNGERYFEAQALTIISTLAYRKWFQILHSKTGMQILPPSMKAGSLHIEKQPALCTPLPQDRQQSPIHSASLGGSPAIISGHILPSIMYFPLPNDTCSISHGRTLQCTCHCKSIRPLICVLISDLSSSALYGPNYVNYSNYDDRNDKRWCIVP